MKTVLNTLGTFYSVNTQLQEKLLLVKIIFRTNFIDLMKKGGFKRKFSMRNDNSKSVNINPSKLKFQKVDLIKGHTYFRRNTNYFCSLFLRSYNIARFLLQYLCSPCLKTPLNPISRSKGKFEDSCSSSVEIPRT